MKVVSSINGFLSDYLLSLLLLGVFYRIIFYKNYVFPVEKVDEKKMVCYHNIII